MKKFLVYSALLLTVVTGCRKIEEDGEVIVINGGGNGRGASGQSITIQGRIDKDTVLRKGNDYILKGLVYIANNATITIEPGVTVKGAYTGSDVAALIITRGAKINAVGTQDAPIIFTSASPTPRSGDWGGIVICGKASINTTFAGTGGGAGIYEVEGGINNSFGDGLAGGGATPNDDDSSGALKYARIEYAGYAYQPDKEINSLTLAAVGRKTVVENIQVLYAKDDAFEWFGGTVNCKYLVAYKTQDDDFDTDNGYRGNVQFGLIIRDSLIADISRSESFESDNNSSGTAATPKTSAVFSNITSIGPRAGLSNQGNLLFLAAVQIRRNSSISIFNSVFIGWPTGILIDAATGTPTDHNISDNSLRIQNTVIAGCNTPVAYTTSPAVPTGATQASINAWFTGSAGNTIVANVTDAKLIQPFNYAAPDATPFAGTSGYAPIVSGAAFTDSKVSGSFFTKVTFRGAIAPAGSESTWWKGWTRFPLQ
ncbi:MAG: hypothetical protein JWQ96_374 [Segetibacter sp.]|nr:hypothetical protein [Segetibacter sp.]